MLRHHQDRRSLKGCRPASSGFFQSFILMIGGFIAPLIRGSRRAPHCSARSRRLRYVHLDAPALEMYMTPQIGVVCFAIIL